MIISDPKFKSVFTKGRAWNLYELDSVIPEINNSSLFVVKPCCEFFSTDCEAQLFNGQIMFFSKLSNFDSTI